MKEKINKVINLLLEKNFEFSYIKEIYVKNGYEFRLNLPIDEIVIVHEKHEYLKRISNEIKIEGIEISQMYVGEYEKESKISKSFWVKRTEKEKEVLLKSKDPCLNCVKKSCLTNECLIKINFNQNF